MSNFIAKQLFSHSILISKDNEYFHSSEEITILPYNHIMVPTGISTEFDSTYVLLVKKYNLPVLGGVVDSDYKGQIYCILYNNTNKIINISIGDKIGKFVLKKLYNGLINGKEQINIEKERIGGFGSTGKV